MFENLIEKLKKNPTTLVFTEGTDARILEAASRLKKNGILEPLLIGVPEEVQAAAEKGGFDITDHPCHRPRQLPPDGRAGGQDGGAPQGQDDTRRSATPLCSRATISGPCW